MNTNETSTSQDRTDDARQRPAWALPVGLGAGLLSVGGFFVLVAHGLSILASIG